MQAAISQVGFNPDYENFAEVGLFDEMWPARHNQELWGTAPSGIYDRAPLPELAQQRRANRQQ
jgi:hypothetical protein